MVGFVRTPSFKCNFREYFRAAISAQSRGRTPFTNGPMKLYRWILATLLLSLMLGAVALRAQRGRLGGRSNAFNSLFGYFDQNAPPDTEFVLARWHYTAGWGGGGWSHDYPTAEQ